MEHYAIKERLEEIETAIRVANIHVSGCPPLRKIFKALLEFSA
jgi:hypothetical protein